MVKEISDLRLLFWELTARCNLRCRHCRAEAQECFTQGELSTEEIIKTAHAIRKNFDPIMILTGGEPLVRNDIFDIAKECSRIFSRVALATNGTLIDDKMVLKIIDSGIQRVSISLDGAKAETHDRFRGQPGSFEGALKGIDALRRAGVPVQINATVTKHNENELDKILDCSIQHGADSFHIFMLVPVGCGAEIKENERLSPKKFEEILRWLFEKSLELKEKVHIKATCSPQYYRIMREISREKKISLPNLAHNGMKAVTRGCLAGSSVCFISRTGDVQPCGYLPLVVGNIRKQDLSDIWYHSDIFKALREPNTLKGKCGACGYKVICQGCRARAYAQTGDFLQEEPDCSYIPPVKTSGSAS